MSALIFVAVAVAWAVYLVPKALRHHEEDAASRTVEHISDRVRVLARRDAVSSRTTQLVTSDKPKASAPLAADTPGEATEKQAEKQAGEQVPSVATPAAAQEPPVVAEVAIEVEHTVDRVTETGPAARTPSRAAARRAAQRRRRVLITLLAVLTVTAAVAIGGYIAPAWTAVPGGLIVAWLVLCRVMVRQERSARTAAPAVRRTASAPEAEADDAPAADTEDDTATGEAPVVEAGDDGPAPGTWEPVPVHVPTYVGKAQAGRTVRTIDLDSTGVWSSGRNENDSQLARQAEAQDRSSRARKSEQGEQRRASGS